MNSAAFEAYRKPLIDESVNISEIVQMVPWYPQGRPAG
jgi:hypothetical protein